MKKTILLTLAFYAFFATTQKAIAQQPAKTSGWYIKAREFEKYAPKKATGSYRVENRYDELGRLILNFTFSIDDTIDVRLYDYDNAGNRISHQTLCFGRDKHHRRRYVFIGQSNEAEFNAVTEKILDRLDEKK